MPRVLGPISNCAVGKITRRLPMPGIVEAQKRTPLGLGPFFKEDGLGSFHIRTKAPKENNPRSLTFDPVIRNPPPCRRFKIGWHRHGSSLHLTAD